MDGVEFLGLARYFSYFTEYGIVYQDGFVKKNDVHRAVIE